MQSDLCVFPADFCIVEDKAKFFFGGEELWKIYNFEVGVDEFSLNKWLVQAWEIRV